MAKIGVEQSLSNVAENLKKAGHEVVTLKQASDAKGCDCCVISGQDENVMGIQNTVTQGSVINASGRSAEEIQQEIEQRL